jgi:hypothetical protein
MASLYIYVRPLEGDVIILNTATASTTINQVQLTLEYHHPINLGFWRLL